MWTEPDVDVRRAVIQSHFDEGVQFHDPDGDSVGHAGLDAFSDLLQGRFPGARFTLAELPGHSATPSAPSGTSGRLTILRPSLAWTSSSCTAKRRAASMPSSTTLVAGASRRTDWTLRSR
jgi:hypothetical protein